MLCDHCRVGMERGGAPKLGARRPITEKLKCDTLLSNSQTKKWQGREVLEWTLQPLTTPGMNERGS